MAGRQQVPEGVKEQGSDVKILVEFCPPPEFHLPGARGMLRSSCSITIQILDFILCTLLGLRNPYFDLNSRSRNARRFVEKCRLGYVLKITTIHLVDAHAYKSTYNLRGFQRVIVTEERRSSFHGRYFHAQRVLAMVERDLVRGLLDGRV